MSTNTLSFTAPRAPGYMATFAESLRAFCESVAAGLAAAHQYQALTARGVPPGKAAQAVFREHFAKAA